uniref:Uncharacterized protein n=1 Tax=Arundo donax TaxID=35708 RepID=A0A0A9CQD9_ARUDO
MHVLALLCVEYIDGRIVKTHFLYC